MPLEFSVAVDQWVRKAKARQDAVVQAIAWDVLNQVKLETPVDTGFLRANWTVIVNNDPVPVPGRVPDAARVIAEIKAGDRVTIVNPVVYALRVEFGFVGEDSRGRTYDQRGRGMVQKTLAKMPEIARRAVARVEAGQPAIGGTLP